MGSIKTTEKNKNHLAATNLLVVSPKKNVFVVKVVYCQPAAQQLFSGLLRDTRSNGMAREYLLKDFSQVRELVEWLCITFKKEMEG